MPKLTTHFVENEVAFENNSHVAFYRDDILKGFGLRVSSSNKSYFAEMKIKGRTRRITLGRHPLMTADVARKKALELLGRMASGVDPVEEKENLRIINMTLEEAFVEYMEGKTKYGTCYGFNRVVRKNLSDWLHLPLTAITRRMVLDRFNELSQGSRTGGTGHANANLTMQVLRSCINFVQAKYTVDGASVVPSNPTEILNQMHLWHRLPVRQTIVPDHKLAAWYKAVMSLRSPISRDYYMTLILTGLRRREAATLEWTDIDMDAGIITLRPERHKTGKEHKLPMSDYLMQIFRRRHEDARNKYVFPTRRHGKDQAD